jgi:TolB-like protein
MNFPRKRVTLVLTIAFELSACSAGGPHRPEAQAGQVQMNLADRTGVAVDQLLGSMSPPLAPETTILVGSFVDLNDMTVSTNLGRLLAEQTAGHLIKRGYRVPEARLTKTLYVRDEGEFMLSRDVVQLKLANDLGAGVVLTGTTSSIHGITYVNFRLVRFSDGIALSASDLELSDRQGWR